MVSIKTLQRIFIFLKNPNTHKGGGSAVKKFESGSLYKIITVEDRKFEIRYGFYSDAERERWNEPTPIYPNFLKEPIYTGSGKPVARADQDVCEHYSPKPDESGEGWCNDCVHFEVKEDLIGICNCSSKRILLN